MVECLERKVSEVVVPQMYYRILKGGTREFWGTLGKLSEHKGIMGITRLPTPPGPPPLKDNLGLGVGFSKELWWAAEVT